jgi:hypothetical protein
MDFNQLLNARMENIVDSLPTGLGSAEIGYTVYFDSQLWVWDGENWYSWTAKSWSLSDIDDLITTPTETTAWNITTSYLPSGIRNLSMSFGFQDNTAKTLGTLTGIGADSETVTNDWKVTNGKLCVITAKDGCWFNIKNNGTPATDCRKIYTNTDTDLNDITKALFAYNFDSDAWILISFSQYERKWHKRYTIDPIAVGMHSSPLTWAIPATGELPYEGYYQVDAFIQFIEYESTWNALPLVQASTLVAQKLTIHNGILGSPPRELMDVSPVIFVQGVATPPKLFNTSLQGSATIYVTGTKTLTVKLELPNCQYNANQIAGGYVHLTYKGIKEN